MSAIASPAAAATAAASAAPSRAPGAAALPLPLALLLEPLLDAPLPLLPPPEPESAIATGELSALHAPRSAAVDIATRQRACRVIERMRFAQSRGLRIKMRATLRLVQRETRLLSAQVLSTGGRFGAVICDRACGRFHRLREHLARKGLSNVRAIET